MLVLLNDETPSSTWCQLEWRTAVDLRLPIKVVVDLEHTHDQALLLEQCERDFPALLRYQWTYHTSSQRRDTLHQLVSFLALTTNSNVEDDDDVRATPLRMRRSQLASPLALRSLSCSLTLAARGVVPHRSLVSCRRRRSTPSCLRRRSRRGTPSSAC